MSDPLYQNVPTHVALENVTGATALQPLEGAHTTQIGRPHTNSIDSNKSSGRIPSINNGASCPIGSLLNRPIFNKVRKIVNKMSL